MTRQYTDGTTRAIVADWRDLAECLEADPDLFYPDGDTSAFATAPIRRQIDEAKTYCCQCPVTGECLDWALGRTEFGIWGGTTREERNSMLRRRRKTA